MIYRVLHWIANITIHWFYRDIDVVGLERIPCEGPLLVAVNHQNALVDAIMAGWAVPRKLTITAKATLADSVFGTALFKAVGIIALHRPQDERDRKRGAKATSVRTSNIDAFRRIIDELARGGAVLIFPEGKSHNTPVVAPLKTGLARVALRARDDAGVRGVHIIPIGLTFEDKARPGTVAVAQVGDVIAMDDWPGDSADELTEAVAERLRAVSLTADIARPVAGVPPTWPVRVAAWWGRVNHKVPIELARTLAVAQSEDEGEPAMFTIVYGLVFTLVAYVVQTALVWVLVGPVVAVLYLVSLPVGAYWAAYAGHAGPPR